MTVNDNNTSRKRQRRSKLDQESAEIVIVGAGLAGLSAAIALTRAGFRNVSLWERDSSLESQKEGYGLTLTYNPKGPLAALGVLEMVAQADCPSRSHYLFRAKDGLPLGYFGNAFYQDHSKNDDDDVCIMPKRGQGQRGNLRVPRKVLRKILYDKLVEEKEKLWQAYGSKENIVGVYWNHKLLGFQWDSGSQKYKLQFEELSSEPLLSSDPSTPHIISVSADLLIAADGIRSTILQQMYIAHNNNNNNNNNNNDDDLLTAHSVQPPTIYESPEYFGLRPLGVRLILGIADFDSNNRKFDDKNHPLQLLYERGFYTLDGQGRRLFTMPYQSSRFANDNPEVSRNRIMWQLSFATTIDKDGEDEHQPPLPLDAESLRVYVTETCQSWHEPVMDLINATPLESIWGTDLMDRDSRRVYEELVSGCSKQKQQGQPRYPRLVVVGDALHSMSPFKGQGANQALADGPLLAQWLQKSSVDAAITGWWRETLNRTVPVVEASRKAAQELHSTSLFVVEGEDDVGDGLPSGISGLAGIQPDVIGKLIRTLQQDKIGAHLGRSLDRAIYHVVETNGWFQTNEQRERHLKNGRFSEQRHQWEIQALRVASDGDTETLRLMSLDRDQCASILTARDTEQQQTCLHLAVLNNHFATAKWLLVELKCNTNDTDMHGKTPRDYARINSQLAHIFNVVAAEDEEKREMN
ncbi:FAD-binding monooxygenase [Nitzschia inconspicua]|uniref:FAD-binding monooxygenase n=1 Tax=Nitzschia inconspicua TaxID=303405 RepID=A0A9K3M0Q2_9STRA|nr:FAD-binding monooxygenase [Nitzschia inconspicua]